MRMEEQANLLHEPEARVLSIEIQRAVESGEGRCEP